MDSRISNFIEENIKECMKRERVRFLKRRQLKRSLLKIEQMFINGRCLARGLVQIPHMDLVVGTKCTLRCKYCSEWNPYIENSRMFDADTLIQDMKNILSNVDYIHRISVIGGECFLHKDIYKIICFLKEQKKIGLVVVITNGTIYPNEKVLELFKDNTGKIELWIDSYGKHSRAAKKLLAYCKQNKDIVYIYNNHMRWYDYGVLDNKKIKELERVKKAFETCHFGHCSGLVDGCLYRCDHTWTLLNNKLEKPRREEVINIRKIYSKKQMLHELIQFYSIDYIKACAWCNEQKDRRALKPGEQL